MDQKQQIADRLKQANNILVTVSNNPSVDQLASCIGLTLAINKMGKHATAVFSGTVPSTIEFLQPEKTLESNTDSLRDFIISLDKAKADKLRYKVEDKVVKIFITPYRTSITESDLEFGQGDFNVDVVLALGVHSQNELDQAITSHGRILHDATVATINVKPGGELGSMNWLAPASSSLSELAAGLITALDRQLIDEQIATAFLTGIVAETNRFSNERTSPETMSVSAQLMSAGANQQLVATKLESPPPPPQKPAESPKPLAEDAPAPAPSEPSKPDDGALEIPHADKPPERSEEDNKPLSSLDDLAGPETEETKKEAPTPRIHIDDQGSLRNIEEKEAASTDPTQHIGGSRMILQPPSSQPAESLMPGGEFGGEELPSGEPSPAAPGFGAPALSQPLASATITPPPTPFMPPSMTPGAPPAPVPAPASDPLARPVDLPLPPSNLAAPSQPVPLTPPQVPSSDQADQAFSTQTAVPPEPIQALNAQPLGDPLHGFPPPPPPATTAPPDLSAPLPNGPSPAYPAVPPAVGAPPPGPPPMMPLQPQ